MNVNLKTYTVLLVEDDLSSAKVIAAVLAAHQGEVRFTVDTVNSVAGCEAGLRDHDYDILLLDLNLVDSKGEETFRKVYALANKDVGKATERRLPVIVLTADTEVGYSTLVGADGAQDFVRKPFIGKDLCERMHMAIIRFPWKRTRELFEDVKTTLQAARDITATPPCD